MIFQFILLLVLSSIVVIYPGFFVYLLHWLHRIYSYLGHWLGIVFSHSAIGKIIQSTLALLIVPLFVGLICMIFLKIMQKKKTAYVMQVIWVAWMLLAATIVLT